MFAVFESSQLAFHLLSERNRQRVIIFSCLQVLLVPLELFNLVIASLLISISLTSFSNLGTTNVPFNLKSFPEGYSAEIQLIILTMVFVLVSLVRAIASTYLSRILAKSLADEATRISDQTLIRVLKRGPEMTESLGNQNISIAMGAGANSLIVGTIGSTALLFGEIITTTVIFVGLFVVDIALGLSMITCLVLAGIIIHRFSNKLPRMIGQRLMRDTADFNSKVVDSLKIVRELNLVSKDAQFVESFSDLHSRLSRNWARLAYIPNYSKYMMEISALLTIVLIGTLQLIFRDFSSAITFLGIGLISLSRVLPSMLRAQANLFSLKLAEGQSQQFIEILNRLKETQAEQIEDNVSNSRFEARVEISNVHFSFNSQSRATINGLNLVIEEGERVAITGVSGAGKTTLLELIMGFLTPDTGSISISNASPSRAYKIWPGSISYVPQTPHVFKGNVLENIALVPREFADRERARVCLEDVGLSSKEKPVGLNLDTELDEDGFNLSGGQKQRLVFARALYTAPKLMILDEPNSALDYESESVLLSLIKAMDKETTVIFVTHRKESLTYFDKVLFFEQGELFSNSDEIRKKKSK